jgi:cellulose synthase/poly-beta-1,6-N-acetylglucosamine synthase-like glycosyltransferase
MWTLGTLLATMVAYLVFLTVAALFAPSRTPLHSDDPLHQFVFLIPAHNEERLLPTLLKSLSALDYPRSHYCVHVVADNCTDRTAAIARELDAITHERFDTNHVGKGYALQWLLGRLWQQEMPFDGAIILDADSIVSPNFLRVMNAKICRGGRVVQAYYAALAPEQSWAVGLRAAALAAIHYLRPQARMVINASAGLKGNGMLFRRVILQQHSWSESVTEDIEYHMALLLAGERVLFAPDALVRGEMPAELRTARTQNIRWEQGRVELAYRYVPQLLRAAWASLRGRGVTSPLVLLDAVMEHVIPPFSLLVALSVLLFFAAILLGSTAGILLALSILIGEIGYMLASLMMSRAPRQVYFSLLYTPAFLLWKCWLYVRVLLRMDRQEWIRTTRIGEGS